MNCESPDIGADHVETQYLQRYLEKALRLHNKNEKLTILKIGLPVLRFQLRNILILFYVLLFQYCSKNVIYEMYLLISAILSQIIADILCHYLLADMMTFHISSQ